MTDHRDPLPISTQNDLVRTTDEVVQTAAETVRTQHDVRTVADSLDTPDDTPPPTGDETAVVPPDAIPQ